MNKTLSGVVIHGNALGRTIGFPTANISLKPGIIEDGVYALRIGVKGIWYTGIGTYREDRELFEANIFDFEADIYDELIEIETVEKIRENQKFPSFEDLRHQIEKDSLHAKKVLNP